MIRSALLSSILLLSTQGYGGTEYRLGGDDGNGWRNPEALEICDGQDNNCDNLVDDEDPNIELSTGISIYLDDDGDGYANLVSGGDEQSVVDLIVARFTKKRVNILLSDRIFGVIALSLNCPNFAFCILTNKVDTTVWSPSLEPVIP